MAECCAEYKPFSVFSIYKWLTVTFALFAATLTASASTITVPVGGNLQSAINAAQYGDTIILEAGATYTGSFVLPLKSGTGEIVIQSSRVSELPEGVRVNPSQSALLARIQSATPAEPVVKTVAGAHHYRFAGIEFSTTTETVVVYDLVRFGESGSAQNTLTSVPNNLIIDRSYIHGFPTQDVQRGVSMNCAECSITNSYISDIHGVGYDTQAICGWNGPGPFHIVNNYLEGAGENVLFGGADPSIPNLVPSDIEIRRNYVFKPLSWKVGDPSYAGKHWTVKNLLELKNANRVTIDGNVFENAWVDGQVGIPILFTVRNQNCSCPWCTVQNVTFTNNTVRGAMGGLNFLGKDNEAEASFGKCTNTATQGSVRGSGATVSNNLFYNNPGNPFLTLNGFYNVNLNHNTHLQANNLMTLYGQQSQGFVYTNNLTIDHDYGIFGDGGLIGSAALTQWTPGWVMTGNYIASPYGSYPPGNTYPASIALPADFRSPYAGVGADIDALNAAQAGTVPSPAPAPSTTPTPTPNPTATPTPTPTPTSQSSVAFAQLDSTTEGNWKNFYGGEGYNTVNDSMSYPNYAQVAVTGYSSPTWMASTTDVRGLQKASASDRVAARWDSSSSFTVDLNLTDGVSHQIAIYGLDWDGNNRTQRVDVLDWATNALLDSRTISSFNGGQYLVWNIRGHVKITVNKVGGKSAVISGLYFGGPAATPVPTATPTPTVTPTPTPTPTSGLKRGVGKAKRTGQDLSNQLISNTSTASIYSNVAIMDTSAQTALAEFITEIQQASVLFNDERNAYPAAAKIEVALTAAFNAGIGANQAAQRGDLATLKVYLRESINQLELSDVLVTYGDVANPIDISSYMVRQQYVDFLDREPDESGAGFWTNEIAMCGSDALCVEVKRINVSAAFFLSIEFQQTGYFVYRLYKVSYGRVPMRLEFLPDKISIAGGLIVGEAGWEAKLAGNKQAFLQGWVQRPDFQSRYGSLSNEQYIDTLIVNAGVTITPAERDDLVQDMLRGASRADVLGKLVDNPTFTRAESNSAFVLMQYFGYLGRDPDQAGFNFWLNKLNQFDGNYINAEMVKAFLNSGEFRHRFGQ